MNKSLVKMPWTRVEGAHNMILKGKGFMISYNPIAGTSNGDPVADMAQKLGAMIHGEARPQEETALHDGKVWLILLGDYRQEYEQAYPNLKKCIAVYDKYKADHRSEWSTDD